MKKNLLKFIVGGIIAIVCMSGYFFIRPKEEPWKYTTRQIETLKVFLNNQIAPDNFNLFTQLQFNDLTYTITENDYGENFLDSIGICYADYFNDMITLTNDYENGKINKESYIKNLTKLYMYITDKGEGGNYVSQIGNNEEIKNTLKPFEIILKYGSPYDKEKCEDLDRIVKSFRKTYNEYSSNYIQYDLDNGKINVLNINKLKYYENKLNNFNDNIYEQNKYKAIELKYANQNPIQI